MVQSHSSIKKFVFVGHNLFNQTLRETSPLARPLRCGDPTLR
jgi:hypothetical protein